MQEMSLLSRGYFEKTALRAGFYFDLEVKPPPPPQIFILVGPRAKSLGEDSKHTNRHTDRGGGYGRHCFIPKVNIMMHL